VLLGFIKEDYFERKYLNVSPSAAEEYAKASEYGNIADDKSTLASLLGL
jgi:hypothetical protein